MEYDVSKEACDKRIRITKYNVLWSKVPDDERKRIIESQINWDDDTIHLWDWDGWIKYRDEQIDLYFAK